MIKYKNTRKEKHKINTDIYCIPNTLEMAFGFHWQLSAVYCEEVFLFLREIAVGSILATQKSPHSRAACLALCSFLVYYCFSWCAFYDLFLQWVARNESCYLRAVFSLYHTIHTVLLGNRAFDHTVLVGNRAFDPVASLSTQMVDLFSITFSSSFSPNRKAHHKKLGSLLLSSSPFT